MSDNIRDHKPANPMILKLSTFDQVLWVAAKRALRRSILKFLNQIIYFFGVKVARNEEDHLKENEQTVKTHASKQSMLLKTRFAKRRRPLGLDLMKVNICVDLENEGQFSQNCFSVKNRHHKLHFRWNRYQIEALDELRLIIQVLRPNSIFSNFEKSFPGGSRVAQPPRRGTPWKNTTGGVKSSWEKHNLLN